MMDNQRTQLVLTIGLLLFSMRGSFCQELLFEHGLQQDDQGGNWTANGRIRLTHQDTIIFEPLVMVQAMVEICSINLKSCAARGQAPPLSTSCFCTEVSDEEYALHISSDGEIPNKELTVQANVPSRYMFQPLSLSGNIGRVPGAGLQVVHSAVCSDRVTELEETLVKMVSTAKTKEETLGQLVTKNSQLTTENNRLVTKNNHLSAKDDESVAKLKKADEIISQLQTKNSQMTVQISQLTTQTSQLTSQISARDDEIVAKLKKADQTISQLQSTNSQLMAQTSQLLTQLSKKDDEIRMQTTINARITDTSNAIDEIHDAVVRRRTCETVTSRDPRPVVSLISGMEVVCDTTTDNGGWLVLQRRTSGEVDFFRDWVDYKNGFGEKPANFWLGLENIHRLTINNDFELRVDMVFKDVNYFAKYDTFLVMGEEENYKLFVSGFSGNASDSLDLNQHNDKYFSTKDRDHDTNSGLHCAHTCHGGWWFGSCHSSNLNGKWGSTALYQGLSWGTTTGNYASLSFSEMKIRRRRP